MNKPKRCRQLQLWHGGLEGLMDFLKGTIGPRALEPQTIRIYSTSDETLFAWARGEIEAQFRDALVLTKVAETRIGEPEIESAA